MGQTGHLIASAVCSAVLYKWYSKSTWNTYTAGQQHYLTFCTDAQRQAVPTSESTLMLFVSHLSNLGITHSTIKVYVFFFYSSFTRNPRKTLTVLYRTHTSLTAAAERH